MPKRVSPPGSAFTQSRRPICTTPNAISADIPMSRLELSPGNVRKTPADASAFTELKASIAAHGLLENLIARYMGPGPDGIGRYAVIAGGRRLAAMQALGCRGRAGRGPPRALPHDRKLSWRPKKFRWPRTVSAPPCTRPIRSRRSAAWPMRAARRPPSQRRFGVSERTVEKRLTARQRGTGTA